MVGAIGFEPAVPRFPTQWSLCLFTLASGRIGQPPVVHAGSAKGRLKWQRAILFDYDFFAKIICFE